MPFVRSRDGTEIYFETYGRGGRTLLFVHGWIGNARWWDAQREAFADFRVAQMDLAGHGRSGKERKHYTIEAYAEDICAVAEALGGKVTIVGHSMSGAHATVAAALLAGSVDRLVLVDTLQDLDHMPTMAQVETLFVGMRTAYEATIRMAFPNYMFTEASPASVVERVVGEALAVEPALAANLLRALYETDIRSYAAKVAVPVRAINSELAPTQAEANRKYFRDFDFEIMKGVGHYPMMERPSEFNAALRRALT